MTTASRIITLALRRARAIGVDQTPSAEDSADALDTLNQLLDSWWNERLAVYRLQQETFAWPINQASRTIGAGGNFVTTRPLAIHGAYYRLSSIDHPLGVIDRARYDFIADKAAGGLPDYVFYDPLTPLGVLTLSPVPNQAITLVLNSQARLESFATAAEEADLPPGYDRALIFNLAKELAGDYGLEVSPRVDEIARESKAILKRHNTPEPIMAMPASVVSGDRFSITTG